MNVRCSETKQFPQDTLLLIFSLGKNASGIFDVSGQQLTDESGNVVVKPDNNFCSLVFYVLTLFKNLLILWRLFLPMVTDQLGTTVLRTNSRYSKFPGWALSVYQDSGQPEIFTTI
jgi:hypothetical protein